MSKICLSDKLELAISEESVADIRRWISAGLSTNAKLPHGTSALTYAIALNRISAVKELLALGADVNHCDTSGNSPLHAAVEVGNETLCNLLLTHGGNPFAADSEGWTAFCKACGFGEYGLFDCMCQHLN